MNAQGFDVCSYEGNVDYSLALQNNLKFVYVHATWGDSVDSTFQKNWTAAKAAGVIRGAYYAPKFALPPMPQLDRFFNTLGSDLGELPVCVDVERNNTANCQPQGVLTVMNTIFSAIEAKTKRKPVLYTNLDLLKNYFGTIPDWLLQCDLWIADYNAPNPPNTYKYATWTFRQTTDRGDGKKLAGTSSLQLDLDEFNGDETALRVYANLQPPPPTIEQRLAKLEAFCKTLGYPG